MNTEAIKTYYRAYFPDCTFNDSYDVISVHCLMEGADWYLGAFGNNNHLDSNRVMYCAKSYNTFKKLSNLLQELKKKIGNN